MTFSERDQTTFPTDGRDHTAAESSPEGVQGPGSATLGFPTDGRDHTAAGSSPEGVQGPGSTTLGEFVCVMCPNGCLIEAKYTTDRPAALKSLSGNRCKKGKAWVKQEIENPMRTIATSVTVLKGDFGSASVRTTRPVSREKIFEVMGEIRGLPALEAPVHIGQVILKNPAGTETEVVATREVARA